MLIAKMNHKKLSQLQAEWGIKEIYRHINLISPIMKILVARAVHREASFTIRQSLKHYDHTAQLSTENMNKIRD